MTFLFRIKLDITRNLSRYQKTVNSPQHRRWGENQPGLCFVYLRAFFLQSLIIFHSLYISHFILSNFKLGFQGANGVFLVIVARLVDE